MINGGSGADVNARYPEWSATDTVPYRVSSFAPSRAAGSLRGYRCPSSRPAGFAGRRGGGILLLYSISSYFTYSVFVGRGTGHRDGDHGANAATRTREEARNWSKIASTWPERIRWTKIGKVVLPCPIRWYVVTVSGYLKRHNVRRRKIFRNITDSFVRLSFLLERTTSFWNGTSMVWGFDTSSSCCL